MKALVFAILPTAFLLLSANAEEFNATNANGLVSGKPDLASLDYWQQMGKDRLPQSADTVKLSGRATENPYCASADLSIYNILFSVSGSYIDLTTDDGSQRTITLTTDGNAMEFSSGSAGYRVKGGKWYLSSGKGDVYCGRANAGSQDGHIIEFDGCIVTNADRFYCSYWDRSTTLSLVNGVKIYATQLSPAYGNYASNSVVKVSGGSHLVSIGRMVQGDGTDPSKNGFEEVGNNLIDVYGEGSLLKMSGTSLYGHRVPHNKIKIRNKGRLECGALQFGSISGFDSEVTVNGIGSRADTGEMSVGHAEEAHSCKFNLEDGAEWYSTGSLILGNASYGNSSIFSASTGSCGAVTIGNFAISSNNIFRVVDGSKLTLRGGSMFTVGATGSCNQVEISGGSKLDFTSSNSSRGMFVIGKESSSTGNVLRISGDETAVDYYTGVAYDPFGLGSHNQLLLEDGAVLDGSFDFAANAPSNLVCISNATLDADHIHLGYMDRLGSRGNVLKVIDGASVTAKSLSISAFDNTLFVSNATVSVDDANNDRGFRIGYVSGDMVNGGASNATVHVAGETPRLASSDRFSTGYHTHLRFSIPKKGWVNPPIDVRYFSLGVNTKMTVDCDEFCQYTGGPVVLINTQDGFNDNLDRVVNNANAAVNVAANARFVISSDRKSIIFRSTWVKGTVVTVR